MSKITKWIKAKLTSIGKVPDPLSDGEPDDAIRDRQLRSMIRLRTWQKSQAMKKRLQQEIRKYNADEEKKVFNTDFLLAKKKLIAQRKSYFNNGLTQGPNMLKTKNKRIRNRRV